MNIAGKSNGGAQVDETFTVFVKDYCPNCMPGKVEPKAINESFIARVCITIK